MYLKSRSISWRGLYLICNAHYCRINTIQIKNMYRVAVSLSPSTICNISQNSFSRHLSNSTSAALLLLVWCVSHLQAEAIQIRFNYLYLCIYPVSIRISRITTMIHLHYTPDNYCILSDLGSLSPSRTLNYKFKKYYLDIWFLAIVFQVTII